MHVLRISFVIRKKMDVEVSITNDGEIVPIVGEDRSRFISRVE